MKTHTYFAGVSVDDEELDDIASAAYSFVYAAYCWLTTSVPIYVVAHKDKETMKYLDDTEKLSLIKVYDGGSYLNDEGEEPDEEMIKEHLASHFEKLALFDCGYWYVWLAFEYPEEDPDDFTEPGEIWEYEFQHIANSLGGLEPPTNGGFSIIGYNSEIEDKIWQQWDEGDYDEGAISNPDQADHYSGENLYDLHSFNLDCFNLPKLKKL